MPSITDTTDAMIRCPNCGADVSSLSEHCPACGGRLGSRSARISLVLTVVLIFAGFALTQYFVNLHRATEAGLAKRWFSRGEQAMRANQPIGAAECYRTALSYDRENRQYRLRLAEALLTSNHLNEARAHLISLWEQEPANGEVNLALARLYARRGDSGEAIRYYENAINGVWRNDPRQQRTATRFELAHYLLEQRKLPQAQADLMALQADAPPDPADQLLLGQLLLRVAEPMRAVQAYRTVLASDRDNAQAWFGEGQALLSLGDYRQAERATANAAEHNPDLAAARQQLELVRQILRLDPVQSRISAAERAKRVATAFRIAMQRLSSCADQRGYNLNSLSTPNSASAAPEGTAPAPPNAQPVAPAPSGLQLLYISGLQKQASAGESALRKNPDALEPTMQYVYDVEHATAAVCPVMSLADRALLILAGHANEAQQ